MLSSLKKEIHRKDKIEEEKNKKNFKKTSQTSLEKEKKLSNMKKKTNISNNKKTKDVKKEKKKNLKSLFTKTNVTFLILFLLNIILVIYSARKNVVNYVTISNQDIFVSKTRYLLWGRNYINIIITVFFYLYSCVINHFFLGRKNTRKFLVSLFFILIILNILLFFLFTKRIY